MSPWVAVAALLLGYVVGQLQSFLDHRRAKALLQLQLETWQQFAKGMNYLSLSISESEERRARAANYPPQVTRIPPPEGT